jgi:hypothetical protein
MMAGIHATPSTETAQAIRTRRTIHGWYVTAVLARRR